MTTTDKKNIAVAMSGGVDSSVTAALLQAEGHHVFGITMRLWDGPTTPVDDARRVAQRLGIEHHVAAFEDCFASGVMDYFIAEYAAGRTPNPCARCNQLVKFGLLLDRARELGADYLATGHYARICRDADGTPRLMTAVNRKKDQSYFLFSLTRGQLERIIFPLGEVKDKQVVRELAVGFDLPVATKDDSQDICFIPGDDYIGFLEGRGLQPRPGDFVLADGTVVGRHGGIHRYTIGQRRGMGIAWKEPLHVLGIDRDNNRIVVGPVTELYREGFTVSGCNWIVPATGAELPVQCKIRYRHQPVPCRVEILPADRARVTFLEPEKGVTPGQVAVFYRDDEVLGGGWIE